MPLLQQPIESPFDATSTADDVLKGIDLNGKLAVVTGASSGIGLETARALAAAGASLILPVRSLEKGREAVETIKRSTGSDKVELARMDLGDWASVRAFAGELLKRDLPIDILINNAGVMPAELKLLEGGVETQFSVNHLGPMLLTCLLSPLLRKAAPARVIVLSSAAHRRLPAKFDDLQFQTRPYDKLEAYSISKSATSLFACEFNRRMEAHGVSAYAVCPGAVYTGIQSSFTPGEMKTLRFHDENGNPSSRFKSVGHGAATPVWCATSPLLAAGGGVFCAECNISEPRAEAATGMDGASSAGVRPWAVDAALARELWELSETLLKERFTL